MSEIYKNVYTTASDLVSCLIKDQQNCQIFKFDKNLDITSHLDFQVLRSLKDEDHLTSKNSNSFPDIAADPV